MWQKIGLTILATIVAGASSFFIVYMMLGYILTKSRNPSIFEEMIENTVLLCCPLAIIMIAISLIRGGYKLFKADTIYNKYTAMMFVSPLLAILYYPGLFIMHHTLMGF